MSIDDFLRGVAARPEARLRVEKIPTRRYRRPTGYEKQERRAPTTISLDRRTGISEVESGYGEEAARRQAERCLACHTQTVYDSEKCVLCGRCTDVCPSLLRKGVKC